MTKSESESHRLHQALHKCLRGPRVVLAGRVRLEPKVNRHKVRILRLREVKVGTTKGVNVGTKGVNVGTKGVKVHTLCRGMLIRLARGHASPVHGGQTLLHGI
eukprot:1926918-Pyramimonas_sp.AAC.1